MKPNGQFEPNTEGQLKIPTAPPGEAEKYLKEANGDYARADAMATIIALDGAVGRILDKIKSDGLESRTIIVFISDNGGHPENRSENLPLQGVQVERLRRRIPRSVLHGVPRRPAGRVDV